MDIEMDNMTDKPTSGLAKHLSRSKTLEETKAEKRFVLKTDLIVLPLIASMYFLASLVDFISSFESVLEVAKPSPRIVEMSEMLQ
jgi:hypothetical protein